MINRERILVIDDERTLCDVLKLNLELEGYCVDVEYSAEDALKRRLTDYSMILLDVMMEEMSGYEFVSRIRADEAMRNIPVILCTAKDGESDVVEGFMRGADDYIRKPFSMKELVLRVKSVLRRSVNKTMNNTNQLIIYKTLVLDTEKRECRVSGEEITLTKKEFDILALLLSNSDKVFSREEILDAVWDNDVYVVDRTIDVNINRIRKKLMCYGNNITTKQGYGYGFKKEE